MSLPRFRRRLCLVTDVVGYSRHSNAEQVDAQTRLTRVMRYACARAGIVWPQPQKQGDGELLVMRPGLDEAQAVPALILGLRHGLYETNRDGGLFGRLRMRAALAQGTIANSASGFVGDAVIAACRTIDAPQVRAAMAEDDAIDLAIAVTDDIYRDVIAHRYPGLDRDEFRRTAVALPDKGYEGTVWLHTPLPGPTPSAHTEVTWSQIGATVTLGAGLAGLGGSARVRRAAGMAVPGLGAVFGIATSGHPAQAAGPHPDDQHPHDHQGYDPHDHGHHAPDTVHVHLDLHVDMEIQDYGGG
ncbi:hypothetical protein ACIA8K_22700 [Catenuloplanes sp. NPDC051500]|uniref:hypothetical protein n=1 Tax=Catenuloplanes sp. NPDC051500 TaxID=3363959 RepID=UPI00378BEA4E